MLSAWQVLIYINACFQHHLTVGKVSLGRTGKHRIRESSPAKRKQWLGSLPLLQPLCQASG